MLKHSVSTSTIRCLHKVQRQLSFQRGDTIAKNHQTSERTNKNDTPERTLRAVIVKGRRGIRLAGSTQLLTRPKLVAKRTRWIASSSSSSYIV